jgi:hypothetical protein
MKRRYEQKRGHTSGGPLRRAQFPIGGYLSKSFNHSIYWASFQSEAVGGATTVSRRISVETLSFLGVNNETNVYQQKGAWLRKGL